MLLDDNTHTINGIKFWIEEGTEGWGFYCKQMAEETDWDAQKGGNHPTMADALHAAMAWVRDMPHRRGLEAEEARYGTDRQQVQRHYAGTRL